MIWLSAIISSMVFFWFAPVVLSIRVAYDSPMGAWIAVGFALQPLVLERTVFISNFPKRKKKSVSGHALLYALGKLLQEKSTEMDIKVEIGSGDAASTAILCGGCYALAANLSQRIRFRILPVYAANDPQFAARGMLRTKTGHIAIAALAYWREKRRKKDGKKAH